MAISVTLHLFQGQGQGLAVGQGHTEGVIPGAEAGVVVTRDRKYFTMSELIRGN